MRFLLIVLLSLIPFAVSAQPYQVVSSCGSVSNAGAVGSGMGGYIDSTGHICTNAAGADLTGANASGANVTATGTGVADAMADWLAGLSYLTVSKQSNQWGGAFTYSGFSNSAPFGTCSNATTVGIIANDVTAKPQVTCFTSAPQMADFYPAILSTVALYVGSVARPLLATATAANYTATQLLPATPLSGPVVTLLQQQLASCRHTVCTIIMTNHSPQYLASITGVASDGTSLTVSGWYQFGNGAAGQVPANGVDAYIDPDNHPYAANFTTQLKSTSWASFSTGLEIDVLNGKENYVNGNIGNALGLTTNCHGPFTCSQAYIAQGGAAPAYWNTGFFSLANHFGFTSQQDDANAFQVLHTSIDPVFGFISYQGSGTAFAINPASTGFTFNVSGATDGSGALTLGDQGRVNSIQIAARLGSSLPPQISVLSPFTNSDIRMIPKGTGVVRSDTAFRSSVTTVTGLGTCNSTTEGQRWAVSDATAATPGATLTGGGSNHVPAYCNAGNWIWG